MHRKSSGNHVLGKKVMVWHAPGERGAGLGPVLVPAQITSTYLTLRKRLPKSPSEAP
jgi:hypothetical protein